jgi:hypothetical protein
MIGSITEAGMDHHAPQTSAVPRATRDEPPMTVVPRQNTGTRTWEVHEWIGEALVLLGTVTAVHQPTAFTRAVTEYRIFEKARQDRIQVVPLR